MQKRKCNIGRIYLSGNEKRKIKAAKESEIKRVSGAINKFIVKKNSTEIKESGSWLLSSLKDQHLHNLIATAE